jgi:hypothetical protein
MINLAKSNFPHSVDCNVYPHAFTYRWPTDHTNPEARDPRNINHFIIPHPRIELFNKSVLYSIPNA